MVALRVLIVEDTPADAELMGIHLSGDGYKTEYLRVETEEAYLTALATPYDLVLSDWSLPQFSGLRALEAAAGTRAGYPFHHRLGGYRRGDRGHCAAPGRG